MAKKKQIYKNDETITDNSKYGMYQFIIITTLFTILISTLFIIIKVQIDKRSYQAQSIRAIDNFNWPDLRSAPYRLPVEESASKEKVYRVQINL